MSTTTSNARPHLRWALRADLENLLVIESATYDEWDYDEFLRRCHRANTMVMVCEYRGYVPAFLVYELHDRCIFVIRLAVSEMFRRFGIATYMMDKMKAKLSRGKRRMIQTTVWDDMLPGQLFLREQGFRAVKVVRGEPDAYVFRYRLSNQE